MKKVFAGLTILFQLALSSYSQNQFIILTFSAKAHDLSIPTDSIRIENLTKQCDTVLFYPDTSIIVKSSMSTGKQAKAKTEILSIQSVFPNPYHHTAEIRIASPARENILLTIYDETGCSHCQLFTTLDMGIHSFTLSGGSSHGSLINLQSSKGAHYSRQAICLEANHHSSCFLEYNGLISSRESLKSAAEVEVFGFSPGDSLRFTGYALIGAEIVGSDVIADQPMNNQAYLFNIIEGLPCPAVPLVYYGGVIYSTVQIGNQCWFRENLNIGTRINCSQNQSDNGVIEKYCYNDSEGNCNTYGGLYQWGEQMQYSTMQGAKGLCPDGWHIPTDAEWTILTEYLGGESVAGGMMKSTHGWNNNGNGSNSSGYTAFPGGTRNSDNSYSNLWNNANFWSSTETNLPSAWGRFLTSDYPAVGRSSDNKADGFSCRCLKD